MRNLPNLKALRAFEAVARHNSLTAAADELCVGQSAISHQIRQLEEYLGLPVFMRKRYGVELTGEGRVLYATCRRLFDDLGETVDLIRPRMVKNNLRIKVGPFFSSKLIAPRIALFLDANPGVEIHLAHLDTAVSGMGTPDIIISYGTYKSDERVIIDLMQEQLIAVCGAELWRRAASPLELLCGNRLHYRGMAEWQQWLQSSGLVMQRSQQDLIFDDQHIILEAVKEGQGVALMDRTLVEDELRNGQIVQIHPHIHSPRDGYRFLCRPDLFETKPITRKFLLWLQSEIARRRNQTQVSM